MEHDKKALIRTIYLYLFALLGLVLLVIGSVGFVNMGLKAYVFTQADEQQRLWEGGPREPVFAAGRVGEGELTAEDEAAVKRWLQDYQAWKEKSEKVDVVVAQRHRDAAMNLALILVGLPLYWYHWRVIRKDKLKA